MSVNITWFGRCCFLVELDNKKVLFDPYDLFCNVDIGLIEADILISSSTWHDHGHIGASPHAWIFTYPGKEENSGFTITGIEAKENRGSPTVIFNLRYQDISITNFADLGAEQDELFDQSLTSEERDILRSSNIAFMRASITTDETGAQIHNEKILKYCCPNLILLEHYFPKSFIQEQIPENEKDEFLKQNIEVDGMLNTLRYPVEEVDDYKISISDSNLKYDKKVVKLLRIHPQVKYLNE